MTTSVSPGLASGTCIIPFFSLVQPSVLEGVGTEASVMTGGSVSVLMGSTGLTVRKVSKGVSPSGLLPDERGSHRCPTWVFWCL